MRLLLRLIAIAIAVAGLIDPAITVSGMTRARVAVVALQPSPNAIEARDRLVRDLSSSYEIVPQVTSDAAAAVVIGDRYPDERFPDAMMVATVTTSDASAAGVRIVRVDAPREVPAATAIRLDVEIEGRRVAGTTTDVTVAIAGLEVGRASHRWTKDVERWRGGIDAVPVGGPPYVLRVRLKPDTTAAMDGADAVVDLRRSPFRVEFFDPRPSWATTFLRRALEADARFEVATLAFTSRGVSVQTNGAVPPGDPRIDAFEAVVVGGLDRLSAADARSLDRYARERGGAVVIVPDQRIDTGPARDLVSGVSGSVRLWPDLSERLLEQPAKLSVTPPAAPLQASELLVVRAPAPGIDVVARVPGGDNAPVVVSMPRGEGRVLLSGAMDAWRFRAAENGAFDRFWQSTIAGLALAVPPPMAIGVDPPLLRPGESGEVSVRVRSRGVTSVSASLDRHQPIRLVPEPEAGAYRGRFTAGSAPGRSTVDVRAEGGTAPSASQPILVQADVVRAPLTGPALSMLASSHRGLDVTPDRIAELERFLRGAIASPRAALVRHPMRSAWWMLPFASCLSAEWWLRRRRGLR